MTPEEVEAMFRRSGGEFAFARWGRPIAPMILGVDDASLPVLKGAIEAVVKLAGHELTEADPELGTNLMVIFLRDWRELSDTPKMCDLVPGLADLVARLKAQGADQYRLFHYDPDGAIRAAFVFLRMSDEMAAQPAATLALGQMVQVILSWSDTAFQGRSPLAVAPGSELAVLKPEIAALVQAAYDPVLPQSSADPAHALRLWARLARTG